MHFHCLWRSWIQKFIISFGYLCGIGPIPSIEAVREEMKERIKTVLDKTLEELRNKIETKSASTKKNTGKIMDYDLDGS